MTDQEALGKQLQAMIEKSQRSFGVAIHGSEKTVNLEITATS